MAIVYKATLRPSKQAIVTDWLDRQPWGGSGAVEVLGSYRFDDPDGEVGVEALLVDRGGIVLHVPLTYRAAQIAGSTIATGSRPSASASSTSRTLRVAVRAESENGAWAQAAPEIILDRRTTLTHNPYRRHREIHSASATAGGE